MDTRMVLFLACVSIAIGSIGASSSSSTSEEEEYMSMEQGECLAGQTNVTVYKCVWNDACEVDNGNCTELCLSNQATATCLCSMTPRDYDFKKNRGNGHGYAKGHSSETNEEIEDIFVYEPENGCPEYDPCADAETLCPDEKTYCRILYPPTANSKTKSGESGGKSSIQALIEDGVYYKCEKCKKPADDKKSCGDKKRRGRGGRRW